MARTSRHPDGTEEALEDGVDGLYRRLRDDILEGRLEPGSSVSQVELGEQLGVSRTKLREALRMLMHEGLIEARARGVRVAGVSAGDLDELYGQRLMMESLALRQSAPLLTPEEVGELEGLLAQMAHFERVGDYARWDRPHRSFHALLIAHAGPRTRRSVEQLSDQATRYRKLFHASGGARAAADVEHRAILDAVLDGDADAAADELVRHLARTALTVLSQIDPSYEPTVTHAAVRQLTGDEHLAARAG